MGRYISRVAAKLFSERGYDATSVREIVEAAGVTKPTLYYYFQNKEGLARAILFEPVEELIGSLERLIEESPDPLELAARFLDVFFEFVREDPDRSRFAFGLLFGPHGSELASDMAALGDRIDGLWVQLVQRLELGGVVAGGRTENLAKALRGIHICHTLGFLYRQMPLREGLGAEAVRDLIGGFGERRVGDEESRVLGVEP
jgi:AcrR family transcriptional regulator